MTTGLASAATSLIDFGDAGGTTAGNWNNMANAGGNSLTNLIDDTGAIGTIDLDLDISNASGVGSGFGGTFNAGATPSSPFNIATAYSDGLFDNSGIGIGFAFTELVIGGVYEITLYGGRSNANFANGTVSFSTGSGTGGTLESRTATTFTGTANGSGALTLDVVDSSGAVANGLNTTVSALSITAVPEPSSTALLGLGGLALILRRRK